MLSLSRKLRRALRTLNDLARQGVMSETPPDGRQPVQVTPIRLRARSAGDFVPRADRFDPVRFRLLQVLAEKALHQRPAVAPMLEQRALQLLSDYLNAYLPARGHAASLVARASAETPEAATEVTRMFKSGDFEAVRQRYLGALDKGLQAGGYGPSDRPENRCNDIKVDADSEGDYADSGLPCFSYLRQGRPVIIRSFRQAPTEALEQGGGGPLGLAQPQILVENGLGLPHGDKGATS